MGDHLSHALWGLWNREAARCGHPCPFPLNLGPHSWSAPVPSHPGGASRGCERNRRPTQDPEVLPPESKKLESGSWRQGDCGAPLPQVLSLALGASPAAVAALIGCIHKHFVGETVRSSASTLGPMTPRRLRATHLIRIHCHSQFTNEEDWSLIGCDLLSSLTW